ncbi:MAG TPA: nucleoside triphosphate pyrophosphohydrolase [Gemmatimonadota bacterium]|nr:nucleoside triphosphate pyrophosphohydrolase [Gemmatimonadota bacterium]
MTDSRGGGGRPLHLERARPGDEALGRALALVRLLRERCPWDARQTPESLRPYLLEEAHETAAAVAAGDDAALAAELGDLLLNLAFQVVLAEERGAFAGPEVVEELEEKMRRRHPHVYGDAEEPPDWEEMKAAERAREAGAPEAGPDPFSGVPGTLGPLARGFRLQQRAAALGFDWEDVRGPLAKVREELEEIEAELAGAEGAARGSAGGRLPGPSDPRLESEVGDLLFAAVNLARRAGVHPSNALIAANRKFEIRFRAVLDRARARGLDPARAGLAELDALWDEVKGEEAPLTRSRFRRPPPGG